MLGTQASEMVAQSRKLYDEVKGIYTKTDATPEDIEKASKIKAQADELKNRAVALQDIEAAAASLPAVETKANDKPQNPATEFKSLGEFFVAIRRWENGGYRDPRLTWVEADADETKEQKDLAEATGATGGFLVPVEQSGRLMAVSAAGAIVRPRATILPMARRQMSVPALDQTSTTSDVPHFFGGIDVYYQQEASEKTQSDPLFRQINLVAHKLVGYTRSSDELMADNAVALEAFLTGPMGFQGATTWREDRAYFQGTGAGQPLGILNSGALLTVARQEQADVTYEDLANMEAQLYSPNNGAIWVASQSLKSKLMTMNGPTGNPSYLWGNATTGIPNTLLGRPIVFSLDMLPRTTTTSTGDLVLADFSFYLIGDRQQITIESTKFDRWRYDQTSWRAVFRHDGQPWLSAPLTSADGTTQVSPFVALGSKAT